MTNENTIRNIRPAALTVEGIKQKARHSASVLASLVMSGYRGQPYAADVDLVLYRVGITLLAKSIAKDIRDAKRFGQTCNVDSFITITKHEIENEIKYIQQQG